MTLWHENDSNTTNKPTGSMIDVVFTIECKQLPVDHAAVLAQVITSALSSQQNPNEVAVHPIHLAGSQNGWERPTADSSEPLMLSRRTRLRIRTRQTCATTLIETLAGTRHRVAGYGLKIITGKTRPIAASATLFSRYTVFDLSPASDCDEALFTHAVLRECSKLGYQPTKLLCGRSLRIKTLDGSVMTRSVMLADVPAEVSLALQDTGFGELRHMGCGLLIPHKDTAAVS